MLWFNDVFSDEVIAGFSDRSMDFSLSSTERPLTQAQYDYLKQHIFFDLFQFCHLSQVHGNTIWPVDKRLSRPEDSIREADGIMTRLKKQMIAIRTADCLPVFIYDQHREGIALVHAGWKGAKGAIVQEAVKAIRQQWQSDSKDLKIVLGPGIRPCCYEVGSEFQSIFSQGIEFRSGKYYLDLPMIVRMQFLQVGVRPEQIYNCDLCSCCCPEFFSYRRESGQAGRMIAIMMLR